MPKSPGVVIIRTDLNSDSVINKGLAVTEDVFLNGEGRGGVEPGWRWGVRNQTDLSTLQCRLLFLFFNGLEVNSCADTVLVCRTQAGWWPTAGRPVADCWPTECSYSTVKGLLQLGKPHYQQADFRMVQLLQVGTQGG